MGATRNSPLAAPRPGGSDGIGRCRHEPAVNATAAGGRAARPERARSHRGTISNDRSWDRKGGLMKLLYVCSDFGIRPSGTKGASIHLRSITQSLCDLGVEVSLLSPHAAPGRGHPLKSLAPSRS